MKPLEEVFERNKVWVKDMVEQDPDFFNDSAKEQSPDYLWIGCSDSRVPANKIINMAPGDLFVHRNIANTVVHTDINCLSVIQYAVEVLKVKYIIVCGHYGCGGVKASLGSGSEAHDLVDLWLRHIKDVSRFHAHELENLCDTEKLNKLCELNVMEQVRNVCNTGIVQKAWQRDDTLSVHGWIYDMETGLLKDMEVCATSNDDFENTYIQLEKE